MLVFPATNYVWTVAYYPLRLHALRPTYAAGNRTERGLEAKLSIFRYSVIYQI